MKKFLPFALALVFCARAHSQTNLIPNGDFKAANPLQGWRIDFPYEPWYVKNAGYVKIAPDKKSKTGGPCVVIELPPGVAGNEGGKIESTFIKCEPGATYHCEVDVMPWDFSVKIHAEAWVPDPKPDQARTKTRTAAFGGFPAMAMVHRWQFHDPPAHGKTWTTISQDITVPKTVKMNIKGETIGESGWQEIAPQFISLKVYTFEGTPHAGKCYVGPMKIYKK